jgi:hypothetical protein
MSIRCVACGNTLPASHFSASQRKKKTGRKCVDCVAFGQCTSVPVSALTLDALVLVLRCVGLEDVMRARLVCGLWNKAASRLVTSIYTIPDRTTALRLGSVFPNARKVYLDRNTSDQVLAALQAMPLQHLQLSFCTLPRFLLFDHPSRHAQLTGLDLELYGTMDSHLLVLYHISAYTLLEHLTLSAQLEDDDDVQFQFQQAVLAMPEVSPAFGKRCLGLLPSPRLSCFGIQASIAAAVPFRPR